VKLLVYEAWSLDYPRVTYTYRAAGERFTQWIDLAAIPERDLARAPAEGLAHLLAQIGVSFARYLFPLDDFDQLHVEPLWLPPPAAAYFEKSFRRGLAETRYRHGLEVGKPLHVTASPEAPRYRPVAVAAREEALLLNGGGKDSAVAAETLKAIGLPFTWLTVQSPIAAAMQDVIAASGNAAAIHLEHRGRDPEVERRARYPEAVPPRLAFVSLLPALVYGHRYVVTANERSASEPNLVVRGVAVNHQAGKSLAAERAFAAHVERYLLRGVRPFSLLAPLYELQIARLFTRHPAYFARFRSCNVGFRDGVWCGACPKCAFVFLALGAFLPAETVDGIFGADLLAAERIRYWIARLTRGRKPFECVGTRAEAQLALALLLRRRQRPAEVAPAAWEELAALVADCDAEALAAEVLGGPDGPHDIPSELAPRALDHFARELAAAGAAE
jgi:hypothetical protein